MLPDSCWSQRRISHDGIIIHFISAINVAPNRPFDISEIRKILINSPASCHDYIDRAGKIWHFVPPEYRAWHAGRSKFKEWTGLNDNFLGIELAGTVDVPFTDAQYNSLAWLIRDYIKKYGILTEDIKGHEDVSDHTVRDDPKVDPGPYFDWIRLGQLLQGAT